MKFSKTLFLLVGITVLLETSARAQATLSFETAIRPLGSQLTNSEGNQIDADAFQAVLELDAQEQTRVTPPNRQSSNEF